jgi:hypothetical protein
MAYPRHRAANMLAQDLVNDLGEQVGALVKGKLPDMNKFSTPLI